MDTLAAIARQRAVMTTIADMIVAVAVDKSLRVAVGSAHPDEIGFADHLTQALHARGRPCRCLRAKSSTKADLSTLVKSRVGSPTVAVITSGSPGVDEADLCRIDIELHTPIPVAAAVDSAHRQPDEHIPCALGADEADIVVDYLDPDGPTIRHVRPTLTLPPERR